MYQGVAISLLFSCREKNDKGKVLLTNPKAETMIMALYCSVMVRDD
ncbi:MAG: hypothetical protein PHS71_01420 [Proteiniphilum sp.]|nr:hypothetical protein [Proteiniphilum sp.]MDD3969054.1 hypothetical protein [Proteiniphilum sp.]MDD4800119.1 hypothetical protein [Proteiniphilum sp.]